MPLFTRSVVVALATGRLAGRARRAVPNQPYPNQSPPAGNWGDRPAPTAPQIPWTGRPNANRPSRAAATAADRRINRRS